MTANYFMLTKDGIDLGAPYKPLARGAGPTVTNNTDNRAASVRRNYCTNPSFEVDTAGWLTTSGNVTLARVLSPAGQSGSACMSITRNTSAGSATVRGSTANAKAIVLGETYLASAYVRAAATPQSVGIGLAVLDAAGALLAGWVAAPVTDSTSAWTRGSNIAVTAASILASYPTAVFVAPYLSIGGLAVGEVHYVDAVLLEVGSTLGTYFDGSTADSGSTVHGWAGTAHASLSTEGVYDQASPTPLDGTSGSIYDGATLLSSRLRTLEAKQYVPVTGYNGADFRAVRTPGAADDSANPLAQQVYDHGYLLALPWFEEVAPSWPAPANLAVVPVTGTPEASDTNSGVYGFDIVTWPGSGVGVGTIRQILSGAEGSTRKIAAILDLLVPLSEADKTTIASTYTGNKTAFQAAIEKLIAAAGTSRPFWARTHLAANIANAIVGQNDIYTDTRRTNESLAMAVGWGMAAFTAQEHGLVGATFTSTDYTTLTDPLDAVLALPAGY